jgi:alkylation response protein AidB-like acyl-CoA dehydrogenase
MHFRNSPASLAALASCDIDTRRSAFRQTFNGSDADLRRKIASAVPSARLPDEVMHNLIAGGLTRLLLPAEFGGVEEHPGRVLLVIEELSRVSGSLGWASMVACETPILLSRLPRATLESLYATNANILLASSSLPSGIAVRGRGGWCVSGEWPFATGSSHCDFFLAYSRNEEGTILGSLHPAEQLIDHHNWRAIGLKSTATNTVSLNNAFAPDAHTFPAAASQPFIPDAVMRASPRAHFGLHMSAVAMGILAHVVELACKNYRPDEARSPKRRFEDAGLMNGVGKATTVLAVGRAASQSATRELLERPAPDSPDDDQHVATCVSVARYIVSECIETAQSIALHCGSDVVLETNELQECLADLYCVAQHANLSPARFAQLGWLILQMSHFDKSSSFSGPIGALDHEMWAMDHEQKD